MAILFTAGEQFDFVGGETMNWGGSAIRSGWARGSFDLYGSSVWHKSILTFPAGMVTSCWYTFRCYGNGVSTDHIFVGIGDSSAVSAGIFIGSGSDLNKAAIHTYDGTTRTRLCEEAGTSLADAIRKFDLNISSYGGAGTVTLYIDGIQVCTYTGDITATDCDGFDCILIGSGGSNNHIYLSEMIVANEDTRTFGLVTLYPNAAGDSSTNWTGAYTDIDESTPTNDNDSIYSNTNDADMQVNLYPTPTGVFSVKAVHVIARMAKSSGATPGGIALGVKTGGSFDYGSKQTLNTVWEQFQRLMTTNPVTTNAWTEDELDALQLNFRAKA